MTHELFPRAQELLQSMPRCDLHLHTTWTDGKSPVAAYVEAAARQGFAAILFSEHADRTTTWFPELRREAEAAAAQASGLKVLCGVEVRADGFCGELNAHQTLLDEADLVMGVVHRYPDGNGGVVEPRSLSRERAQELEFRASLGLLQHPKLRIFGHPGGTFEKHFGNFPMDLYAQLVDAAMERGVAVELNPAYQRDFPAFVDLCVKKNARVSLGSNAHHVDELGRARAAVAEVLAGAATR